MEFNIFAGHTRGTGYYTGGKTGASGPDYISTSLVDLHSGHPICVELKYHAGTLSELLVDTITNDAFSTSFAVNIPADAGGTTAFVGFTGGTGGAVSTQTISAFQFSQLGNVRTRERVRAAPAMSVAVLLLSLAVLSLFGTYRLRRRQR